MLIVWYVRFGTKRDGVTGEWRKLHYEELNDPYCSPNIFRVIYWRVIRRAGYVARMGDRRGVYRVLVGKTGGKRPLGRLTRRWEDNIKMDLQEVGSGNLDCIELAEDRSTCECGNETSGSIKWGEFLEQLKSGQLLRKDSAAWSEYVWSFQTLSDVSSVPTKEVFWHVGGGWGARGKY